MDSKSHSNQTGTSEKVWCPACNVLMEWEEYREHAKKEFGKMVSYTKCCNGRSIDYDSKGRVRCGLCYKFVKIYEKFEEFIIPQRTERRESKACCYCGEEKKEPQNGHWCNCCCHPRKSETSYDMSYFGGTN